MLCRCGGSKRESSNREESEPGTINLDDGDSVIESQPESVSSFAMDRRIVFQGDEYESRAEEDWCLCQAMGSTKDTIQVPLGSPDSIEMEIALNNIEKGVRCQKCNLFRHLTQLPTQSEIATHTRHHGELMVQKLKLAEKRCFEGILAPGLRDPCCWVLSCWCLTCWCLVCWLPRCVTPPIV